MGKSNFLFYEDWYDVIKEFTPEERLQVYDAIVRYAFEGVMPEDKFIKVSTALMRSTIDRDNEKYVAKCERNRLNIRRRWENTNDTTEYKPIRPNTNDTDND
ncbi:MAG: hypothetical protein II401_10365, partial [Bacteroidales bacterium]|nr:hypothetical protein [Bacteroidales bacterium]